MGGHPNGRKCEPSCYDRCPGCGWVKKVTASLCSGCHHAKERERRAALPKRPRVPTKRELQVAALFATGLPYKGVAAKLRLEYKTVDQHLQNFRAKTGARSLAGVVHYMVLRGIVKPGECVDKLVGVNDHPAPSDAP